MKKAVYFEGANAYDYYAHIMHLADAESAEYEVVLREGDRLIESDLDGVVLVRGNRMYTQKTYMTGFRGVAFVEHTSDPVQEVITLKLLKVK